MFDLTIPAPARELALPEHVVWQTLGGHHDRYATGDAALRRYRSGFPAFAAFRDPRHPDGQALARWFAPGEVALLMLDVPLPRQPWPGWQLVQHKVALRQHWHGTPPPAQTPPSVVRLGARHIRAMCLLAEQAGAAALFAPRSIELGRLYGVFAGEQLVAMAGERMRVPGHREIASVCTLPEQRGRGHARALVQRLVADIVADGERPFLWVAADNPAQRLYEQLGFGTRGEQRFFALRRTAG
jgi:GNAT superfamily N-acetyltransferase